LPARQPASRSAPMTSAATPSARPMARDSCSRSACGQLHLQAVAAPMHAHG
jgi:hypothetical protein